MLRRYITRHPVRWRALDENKRAKILGQLEDAGDEAHAILTSAQPRKGDDGEEISGSEQAVKLEAARVVNSVAKTFAIIDRTQLAGEIKREEWDRLDSGKPTSRTEVTGGLTVAALVAASPADAQAIRSAALKAHAAVKQSHNGTPALPPSA